MAHILRVISNKKIKGELSMKFDARIKPTQKSTWHKKGIVLLLSLLLGFAIYYASTSPDIKELLSQSAKGVVVKTIPLPAAEPLSKKDSAYLS